MRYKLSHLLFSMLLAFLGAAAAQSVAFEDVRVFDGEQIIPQTNVVVQDGVITAVGEDAEIPAGAEVIDGQGKTLLPGLIDAHVHTFTEDSLRQDLVFGVTTVLDMFTSYQFVNQMQAEQEQGEATDRADIFSAGTLATAPGGHGTQFGLDIPTLTSPEEAEAWVQARIAEGSDYIKAVLESGEELGASLPTLGAETLAAIVEAAHERDKLVVTHVQTLDAARTAIEAGTDGLAHVFVDEVPSEEFINLAVEHGIFVIPTLTVFQSIGGEPVDMSIIEDPNLNPYLSPADKQSLQNPYSGFAGLSLKNAQATVRLLHEAGIPILAGTDAMNPGTAYGASLHRELELLVESGLTPSEALAAATSVPARIFGLENRGRIAPGLRADLLLVNGDATEDITATRDIVGVWKAGVQADREAYRTALEAQREAAVAQTEAFVQSDVVLISDFKAGDLSVNFGQPWVVSTDAMAGGTSAAQLEVVEGGAQDSQYALQVSGEVTEAFPFPWAGAMFMPGAQPFTPANLSSKPVLSFWAKGEGGPYVVQVFCQNLGQIPAAQPFEVTAEWQEITFNLTSFNDCDTAGVQAIIFSAVQSGAFAFQLDNVRLEAK